MILVKMANVLMIISKGQMYKKGSMLSFDIVNIFWQWGGHQGIVLRGLCPVVAVLGFVVSVLAYVVPALGFVVSVVGFVVSVLSYMVSLLGFTLAGLGFVVSVLAYLVSALGLSVGMVCLKSLGNQIPKAVKNLLQNANKLR